MMKDRISVVCNRISDHMLFGSIYDVMIKKTKYRDEKLSFLYSVLVGQKHRMLYYKHLKKKYFKQCTKKREWEPLAKQYNDTIWILWLQGMEEAPLLVKRCYDSVKNAFPDKNVILLDDKNVFNFVTLPDYIMEKYHAGIIKFAHLSDLIRLELLINHGGLWVDSTVLITDSSEIREVMNTPLFMYSFYYFGFNPEIMELNNWLIYSETNNNILCLTRELLLSYWKDYDRSVDYFIFQLMLTIATEYYDEEYQKMPIISQAQPHVLATYIFDDYDNKKYKILKHTTGIHKLSTRFNKEKMKRKGTFYDEIIRKGNI